MYHITLTNL